jgi:hypothetical protein
VTASPTSCSGAANSGVSASPISRVIPAVAEVSSSISFATPKSSS